MTRPGRVLDRLLPGLAWAALAVVLAVLAARHVGNPPYTPDSWAYYELSRHVGPDFFRLDTYRSYQSPVPYSESFPPLWPVVLRLVSVVPGLGPRVGFVAAFGCVLGAAAVLDALGRRQGLRASGPVAMLFLLCFRPFLAETVAGRSFPLAVLLLAALLLALPGLAGSPPARRPVVAGALCGAVVLTRSDLALAVALLGGLLLLTRRLALRSALLAAVGVAVTLVPWAVYGLAHFGTPLPSDNSVVAASVRPLFVLDVLDLPAVTTLRDDPAGWLGRVTGNLGPAWRSVSDAVLSSRPVVAVSVAGLVLAGLTLMGRGPRRPGNGRPVIVVVLLAGVALLAQVLVTDALTGYLPPRYATGVVLALVVLGTQGLLGVTGGPAVTFLLVALPAGVLLAGPRVPAPLPPPFEGGPVEAAARSCQPASGTLLVVGRNTIWGARHGALTGRRTALQPTNVTMLSPSAVRTWVHDYDIRRVYVLPTETARAAIAVAALSTAVRLTPSGCAAVGTAFTVGP